MIRYLMSYAKESQAAALGLLKWYLDAEACAAFEHPPKDGASS